MADITSQMIKDLRDKTQAGMLECKKALEESNGDMELATENLRKKGLAAAGKRAGRSAKEGLVVTRAKDNDRYAILLELNCETDFVGKNQEFLSLARDCAVLVAGHDPVDHPAGEGAQGEIGGPLLAVTAIDRGDRLALEVLGDGAQIRPVLHRSTVEAQDLVTRFETGLVGPRTRHHAGDLPVLGRAGVEGATGLAHQGQGDPALADGLQLFVGHCVSSRNFSKIISPPFVFPHRFQPAIWKQ